MTARAALLAWSGAVVLGGLLVWQLAGTPLLILAAAAIPALCYAALIVRIERYEREPAALLLGMFLWGAAAATLLASAANDAVANWLGASRLGPLLSGPFIEETAKGGALVVLLAVRRGALAGVLDGIVYGALIGAGFAMTENVSYFLLAAVQGGEVGLVQSVYSRGVLGSLNHAAFTATSGAGLGAAVQSARGHWRWLVPLAAFALAILEHGAWNAVAAHAISSLLCDAALPGGPCRAPAITPGLLLAIPAIAAIVMAPAIVAIVIAARLALRHESEVIAGALRDDLRSGVLRREEYAELCSTKARRAAARRALRTGGLRAWRLRRRFHRIATELAFRRQRGAEAEAAERSLREQMQAIRGSR